MIRRRTAVLIALALAAIVAVAGTIALRRLDTIVAREIEARGSAMTQTAVRVGSVDVSLATGTATLHELTVANPPGFKAPYAFELGEITVHLALTSIASDPLVIEEIRIGAPRVTCELDASGTTNIEVLRRAIEAAERDVREEPRPTPAAPEPRPPRQHRRLIIDLLELRDGEVYVDARAIGGPEQREQLPGFELTEIGTEQGGATPPEIGRIIITAVARDVAVAVAATQLERYIGPQATEWLKKGGAEVIRRGLGDVLDKILR